MQSPFHKSVMALLCWAILLLSACKAETPRPPQKSPEQIERERQRAAREAAEIEAEARAQADSIFRAATGQEPPGSSRRPAAETSGPAAAQTAGCLEIPVYQSSRGGQVIAHTGFTLSYDADFKTPQWVGWVLTAERANGSCPRYDKFQPDPAVRGAKAYTKDYTRSGYDRGHIAPAGDMKWNAQAMRESFYMSNICPQNQNLNRGDWKDLEELEREWAMCRGTLAIVAGPVYSSANPPRIGNNRVAVPDGFFKVILVQERRGPKAYAFVFRNEAGSRPLRAYQRTVDEVEALLGMDFFAPLPDDVENRIEAEKPAL